MASGEAVLNLGVDSANVRRAFGSVVGEARRANNQLLSEARRTASEQTRIERQAERERTRTLNQEKSAAIRAANEIQRAQARSTRDATKAAEAESRKRERLMDREVSFAERAASKRLRAHEQAERRATAVTEREGQARERVAERMRVRDQREARRALVGRVVGVAGRIASGVGGGISETLTNIQDARQRRAATDRVLSGALYQAGTSSSTVAAERERVHAFARQHGLDSAEIAQGLNAAQTEFNVLGNSGTSAQERTANLDRALETARFARNTGQNVGEVMRVQGLLAGTGMSGAAQRQTLLGLTGMAQRGAIELGGVSRQAMAPMMQRIQSATEGVADPQARAHATQRAVLQTMAELEVGRSAGRTPRQVGRITAQMDSALQGSAMQGRMITNLQHAGMTGAIEHLFATDSHGVRRLRGEYQTTTGLAGGMTEAGMSPTQMRNALAGSGHGNAQSMQSNYRDMLALFMGEGNEHVRNLVAGVGHDFTEANVATGEGIFGNDAQSRLNKENETRENALLNNTGALVAVNQSLQEFRSASPLLASVANKIGGEALEAVVAPNAAPQGSASTSSDILRDRINASAQAQAEGIRAGGSTHDRVNQLATEFGNRRNNAGAQIVAEKDKWTPEKMRSMVQAAANGLHLTATIDPHDVAQAAAAAASKSAGGESGL